MGEKRTMPLEIDDTIHVLGLQNFINYRRMNPTEVTLNSTQIIEKLAICKKYKYGFLVENLLFSSNLENDTDVIFITCYDLSDVKDSLINSKICKTSRVLQQGIIRWICSTCSKRTLKILLFDSLIKKKSFGNLCYSSSCRLSQ